MLYGTHLRSNPRLSVFCKKMECCEIYLVFCFWTDLDKWGVIRKSSKNWVELGVGEVGPTERNRDTGAQNGQNLGRKFRNANNSTFDSALRAESNNTKIIAIGRFWTKLWSRTQNGQKTFFWLNHQTSVYTDTSSWMGLELTNTQRFGSFAWGFRRKPQTPKSQGVG